MEKIPGLKWATAQVIKKLRESRGLTQGQLADLAGLSEGYLSCLERGVRGDSTNALIQIARALEVDFDVLAKHIEVELAQGARKPENPPGRPPKHQNQNQI